MIKVNNNSIIYILCLPDIKTGGTELLHQLVFELKNQGVNAKIVYTDKRENPVPQDFIKYGKEYCYEDEIVLNLNNVLIFPEIMLHKIGNFKGIRKVVWWLSVDNFKNRNGFISHIKYEGLIKAMYHKWKGNIRDFVNIKKLQNEIEENWVQSFYAKDFLQKYGVKKIEYLSDYINDVFFTAPTGEKKERKNIVLYNPKKGYMYTKKLIEKGKDIEWIPIENLTTEQVRALLLTSKVYIDFGNHPGKDRFPREAAMSGCCIVTGKKGAAMYYEDIPIQDRYKFDDIEENIDRILDRLRECMNNYEEEIKNFEQYQKFISEEKNKFIENIREIIIKENNREVISEKEVEDKQEEK